VIAAIVLAAGLARRMGRQKLLLDLEGKPVICWSVERVLPHVDDCIVVTGRDDAALRAALRDLRVRFAVNPRPQDGQGASIAVGAAALQPSTAAALVVLADQPLTPPSVIPALLAAQQVSRKAIAAPSYRGTRGTPVLFAAAVFPELRALGGDSGARAVLDARPDRVEIVEVDVAMPADVDTPEDFARLHGVGEGL
jgi:molybdenum cofactor cytidylyltransferase